MRGGRRQNSGRKQGFAAKNAEEARRILSEMVMREIQPIGEALIARAKKGDISAIRELFDRAFGKAPQTARIEADVINPIPLLNFDSAFTEEKTPPIYGGLSTANKQKQP